MNTITGLIQDTGQVCPVCGNSQWKQAGQAKDYSVSGEWFEIRECTSCHLKATHPQPPQNQIGRYYASKNYISHSDTKAGLTNKLFHKARIYMLRQKHKWVMDASEKQTGKLLDVGAGTGHFAKYMQDHGWEVEALEPDETARTVALDKLNLSLRPLDALATQKELTYDVITLWHVLEHVHDINGYMNQFHSILKPGGVLIIAVPNHTSRDAKQYNQQWAAYDVPRHLWHFSPGSMGKLLTKHQFTLVRKIAMPLDAFYVSMLSERYRDNALLGPVFAIVSGVKTFFAEKKDANNASSLIYIAKK